MKPKDSDSYAGPFGALGVAIAQNAALGLASILQAPNRTNNGPYDPAKELLSFAQPDEMRLWGALLFALAMLQMLSLMRGNTKATYAASSALLIHWLWWTIVFFVYAQNGGSYWGTILAGGLAGLHFVILSRVR